MKQPDIIQTILKDSNYHLTLFTEDEINKLREKVFTKTAVNDPTVKYGNDPGCLDGQDYEALKKAVNGISDEGFRVMEFRNTGQTDTELKNKIEALFDGFVKSRSTSSCNYDFCA